MIAYCESKKIPVKASASKPYSSDENCLHISYEAGKLEDLGVNGVELVDLLAPFEFRIGDEASKARH